MPDPTLAELATRVTRVEQVLGLTPLGSAPAPATPAATKPDRPTGLRKTVLADGRIQLDWDFAPGVTFEVRDELDERNPVKEVAPRGSTRSVRSAMTATSRPRRYCIVAIGPTGLPSDPSDAVDVPPPTAPAPGPPPPTTTEPATPVGASGVAPGTVLDLSRWYLTLPIADPSGRDSSGPWDVYQPDLATFTHPDYFRTGRDAHGPYVEYICPASGPGVTTTSSKSGAARDELREMTGPGRNQKAAWSFHDGRPHTLTCTLTCDGTSISGRKEVIVGQIHGPGGTPPLILCVNHTRGGALEVFRQGPHQGDLLSGLKPGELFTYRIDASHGRLALWACRGGVDQLPANPTFDWPATVLTEQDGEFFKAGAYVKEKLSNGATGRAVVRHYRLDVA